MAPKLCTVTRSCHLPVCHQNHSLLLLQHQIGDKEIDPKSRTVTVRHIAKRTQNQNHLKLVIQQILEMRRDLQSQIEILFPVSQLKGQGQNNRNVGPSEQGDLQTGSHLPNRQRRLLSVRVVLKPQTSKHVCLSERLQKPRF